MDMEECNYTYMLRCADGSLYTGWTNDLEKRLKAHRSGRGGKYTKTHRPVALVYQESFPTRAEAMRREWQIKHLTKAEKERLVEAFQSMGKGFMAGGMKGSETDSGERSKEKSAEKSEEKPEEKSAEKSEAESMEG